jgi:uncharacterized protein (DUF2267 family)
MAMKYDEFVGQVQDRAALGSLGDAVAAIRATLENLALRLHVEAAENLASELPREIGYYLTNARRYQARGERFDLDEFFDRVSSDEPANLPDAVYHARVVMEVLQEAVSRGRVLKTMDALPEEWDRLFFAGSAGPLRGRRGSGARNRQRSN